MALQHSYDLQGRQSGLLSYHEKMSVSTHTENIIEPGHLFHASQVHTAPVIVPNKSNDEFRKARRLNRSVASKV